MEVMEFIDRNGHGIAFVCEKGFLRGVISDGDIRRYILKNGKLTDNVGHIINYHPKFLTVDTDVSITKFMKENRITAVPIVDQNGRIIRVEFDNGIQAYAMDKLELPLVIMAGGKGTRLYPYTKILPKPLIPIGDQPIIEHIMERFSRFGCNEVYLILNYKKNLIKAFFEEEKSRKIHFIEEKEYLGTGGGLKLLESEIQTTFFLSNCDILIQADYADILNYHRKQKSIITMVCAKKQVTIPYGTVELSEQGNAACLKEKPTYSFLTNTGLYVIEPEFLSEIKENTCIHITDVIQKCMEEGKTVGVYTIKEEAWLDMGQMEELEKMRKRLERD